MEVYNVISLDETSDTVSQQCSTPHNFYPNILDVVFNRQLARVQSKATPASAMLPNPSKSAFPKSPAHNKRKSPQTSNVAKSLPKSLSDSAST